MESYGSLIYLAVVVIAFYFLVIRPQTQRRKQQQALIASLRAGDRVVTAGGVYGTVERVDGDTVQLRIADGVVVELAVGAVVQRAEPIVPMEG